MKKAPLLLLSLVLFLVCIGCATGQQTQQVLLEQNGWVSFCLWVNATRLNSLMAHIPFKLIPLYSMETLIRLKNN